MELKVRVLDKCEYCRGKAYVPVCEDMDSFGNKFIRHQPCAHCGGSGSEGRWVDLAEFAVLLKQAICLHEHVATSGGFHFAEDGAWDDLKESCSNCGADMR